jgi:hypothetical protein
MRKSTLAGFAMLACILAGPAFLTAAAVALPAAAQAQSWMYQSGPGGTPPLMYGGPYGPGSNLPGYGGYDQSNTYSSPSNVYSIPSVPEIRSPVPSPLPGPSSYPCTIPGCR